MELAKIYALMAALAQRINNKGLKYICTITKAPDGGFEVFLDTDKSDIEELEKAIDAFRNCIKKYKNKDHFG